MNIPEPTEYHNSGSSYAEISLKQSDWNQLYIDIQQLKHQLTIRDRALKLACEYLDAMYVAYEPESLQQYNYDDPSYWVARVDHK